VNDMRLIEQLRWWATECDRTNFGCQARKLLLEAAEALEKVTPEKHSFWECYETSAFGGYKGGEPHWLARKFFRCERCRKGSAIKSNFCPNCGADMRERKDGDG